MFNVRIFRHPLYVSVFFSLSLATMVFSEYHGLPLNRFDTIHRCDGRTDKQTELP